MMRYIIKTTFDNADGTKNYYYSGKGFSNCNKNLDTSIDDGYIISSVKLNGYKTYRSAKQIVDTKNQYALDGEFTELITVKFND